MVLSMLMLMLMLLMMMIIMTECRSTLLDLCILIEEERLIKDKWAKYIIITRLTEDEKAFEFVCGSKKFLCLLWRNF